MSIPSIIDITRLSRLGWSEAIQRLITDIKMEKAIPIIFFKLYHNSPTWVLAECPDLWSGDEGRLSK